MSLSEHTLTEKNSESEKRQLELLVGPYRSGKTMQLLFDLLKQARSNLFSETFVLVPSRRYQKLLENRLNEIVRSSPDAFGSRGIVGIRIVTFYKLCQIILRRAGVPFRVVPDAVRPGIIAKVLQQMNSENDLQAIKPISHFTGTFQALLDLIDEFERAALTPQEIVLALSRTAQSNSRYMELARIYKLYKETLESLGFVDEKGLAFQARTTLFNTDKKINIGTVLVDGFDRFNPMQLQVLAGLTRHCSSMRITFDYLNPDADERGEYAWKEGSYSELSRILALGSLPLRVTEHPAEPDSDSNLQTSSGAATARRVKRFKCVDRHLEMDEIARRVKESLVRNERDGSDFLVVVRNVKSYRAPAAAAFQAAGLDYFIDESTQLMTLPLVRFIWRLINLSNNDYRRLDVIDLLRSNYFAGEKFGLDKWHADLLDKKSIDSRVVHGLEHWRDVFSKKTEETTSELERNLFSFLSFAKAPESGYLTDFVEWIENLLERCLRQFNRDDSRDEGRAFSEIRRILAGLVQEDNILGSHRYTTEKFLTKLQHAFDKGNLRSEPTTKKPVLICGAELAPNQSFDEIFIAGLNEGEFPKKPSQNGFLTPEEVSRWETFGINIQNPRFHAGFEFALFASLEQRARCALHLSAPISEMTGEELTPSLFLAETEAEKTDLESVEPFIAGASVPTSERDYLSSVLWAGDGDQLFDSSYSHPGIEDLRDSLTYPLSVVKKRISGAEDQSMNGNLTEYHRVGSITFNPPEQWSASALSSYGKCPFQYWVSRVIKAKPHDEPDFELPVTVIGETFHKAMELFYKNLLAQNLDLGICDQEVARAIFEDAIQQAMELLEQRRDIRRGEFWEYQRNELILRLRRFFDAERAAAVAEPDFKPQLIEQVFGDFSNTRGDAPPESEAFGASVIEVPLKLDGRTIKLRGRIDRIDVAAASDAGVTKIRVVDYKTGTRHYGATEIIDGTELQMPIYAFAADRIFRPRGRVVEAVYLSFGLADKAGTLDFEKPFKPRTKWRYGRPVEDEVEAIDLRDKAVEHIGRIVNGVATGDFSVNPTKPKLCEKCDHNTICRVADVKKHVFEEVE